LARSIEEPPPIETIPSQPRSRNSAVASRTAASVGFAGARSNQVASPLTTRSAMARTPGSVTTSGRALPSSASTSPSSADAPTPKDAVVR